jgi:translation initiation factor 4G
MPETVIRSARPEDARFLAEAMLAASRGHLPRGWYDIALAMPESACVDWLARLAMTTTQAWWHHSHYLIAEADGEPASTLGAFVAGEAFSASGAAMAEAGIGSAEQAAIWERGSYLFLCALGEDDRWTVENVYTAPAYRGRGVASALLERACDEGASRGFGETQISLFIGNDAAERVYRKAGFELAGEKRDPGFAAVTGSPGMRRLVRRAS